MQAAAEIVSVHGAADGLAFSPAHGPTSGSTARAPGLATLDPPGLGPAQRPFFFEIHTLIHTLIHTHTHTHTRLHMSLALGHGEGVRAEDDADDAGQE